MPNRSLVFTHLHLTRPIEPGLVTRFLGRLTSRDTPRPLVFETRADDRGVATLIGHLPEHSRHVARLVGDHFPKVQLGPSHPREPVLTSGRVSQSPKVLPLRIDAPEDIAHALYGSLAARRQGELVVLQIVFGRGYHPDVVPHDITDPTRSSLGELLTFGPQPPSAFLRRQMAERAGAPRIQVKVRIGVAAPTPERRMTLTRDVFGSLQRLESPGTRLTYTREPSSRLDQATLGWTGMALTPAELTALIGWPIGDVELPGIERLRPKRLPVPAQVESKRAVFARSDGAGQSRAIGIDPQSRLQHVAVSGPTGSGKSMVLARLVLDDLKAGRPCVLIEPKRQLVDFITDRVPEDATDRVVVIDATDEHPVGFNPLDLGNRDPDVVADTILASLRAVFAEGWGPRTDQTIHAALVSLARAGRVRGEPYTLVDLPRLLTNAGLRREVIRAISDDIDLREFWDEFEAKKPAQRMAEIAAPLNKLRQLVLRTHVSRVLGQPRPGFRLRDVFRSDKTVLIPLNDALLGTGAATLLGSLAVAEIWMATLERASEPNPTARPGFVVIDEVGSYLHLPTGIDSALATSRSYGVGWTGAYQFAGQLPPAVRDGFAVNARSKIAFAAGRDDARALAALSPDLEPEDFQALGNYEIYASLMTHSGPSDWFWTTTRAPDESLERGAAVRAASAARFGSPPPRHRPPLATHPTSAPPAGASHQRARRS